MSEYKEKIKELRALARWSADHEEEIMQHEDGIVIYVIHNQIINAIGVASEERMTMIASELLRYVVKKQGERKSLVSM